MILKTYPILILLIVSFGAGYLFSLKFSTAMLNLQNKIRRKAKIKKYRIHHDLGGLIIIAASLFIPYTWLGATLSGFGFGIFIHHVLTKGFQFITKVK
jgi:hypothetical protein